MYLVTTYEDVSKELHNLSPVQIGTYAAQNWLAEQAGVLSCEIKTVMYESHDITFWALHDCGNADHNHTNRAPAR